jgi:hypothetical protein
MNSLKSLEVNCGPLSEMIRGRDSGCFSFAPCRMISISASVIDAVDPSWRSIGCSRPECCTGNRTSH